MANKQKLTEKLKSFCREYYSNGGNGTQAYLTAYDSNSPQAASLESSKLLQRTDVQEYLATLNKPAERKAQSEREQKRELIKSRIQSCVDRNDDTAAARWMDILNKMDSEYININRNIDDTSTALEGVDTSTLKLLAKDA